VNARVDQFGRVPDVMQPRGSFEQVGILAEDWDEGAGLCGDTFDVGPAAREWDLEEYPCQFNDPGSLTHKPRGYATCQGRARTRCSVSGRPSSSSTPAFTLERTARGGCHRLAGTCGLRVPGRRILLTDIRCSSHI
jgi:hypothetical protein